jgi:hypothetical protein
MPTPRPWSDGARRKRSPVGNLVGPALVGVLLAGWLAAARADEGMWLFNEPPLELLADRHGFVPPPGWLDHLQRSAVRFNSGGSGSFVSRDGLVLTNHHVAVGSLQRLDDAGRTILRDGFLASDRAAELPCPELELTVLESITDVTERVNEAVAAGMSPEDAAAARRRVLADIEQESLAETGLRSDVVTLWQGGAYHLYRMRRYTDVRLVFAPESGIAAFGGDADNFEFPRYCLDACLFRVYQQGRPVAVRDHLVWRHDSVREGELVFVAGHPGRTDRGLTLAELTALRDRRLPAELASLTRLDSLLAAYAARGPEEHRVASSDLQGVRNGRKARQGLLAGLLDPALFATLAKAEAATRPLVEAADSERPSPYERIEDAQRRLDAIAVRYRLLEGAAGFNSHFFSAARTLVRLAAEDAKPSGERLREYRDSARASLEQQLFADRPLSDAYEITKLADSLTWLTTTLGPDDPLVQRVLDGLSPRERAAALVQGTSVGGRAAVPGVPPRPDRRRELFDGGAAAVAASDDTMVALARLVDDEARRLRAIAEAADEVKRQAHARIVRAKFQPGGGRREAVSGYPDATFTLRLAFGTVLGYQEAGRLVPPFTDYAGLFARAAAKHETPPFDLPERWREPDLQACSEMRATPMNFVCTADIIGGNSGSPVVDRDGRLVGLIFDGNLDSLVLDVVYDQQRARAISVDALGIIAALRHVYRAEGLVHELLAPATSSAPAGEPAKQVAADTVAAEPVAIAWTTLSDGEAADEWRSTPFGGEGDVEIAEGVIRVGMGADLTGVTWTGEFPRQAFELALEARRIDGHDFFCGLTFPVGDEACSLILGGWGGGVVGLSSIDGQDAAHNDTTLFRHFEKGRWYAVLVRVTPTRIECFLDGEPVIEQTLAGRRVSIREELAGSKPLGVATYATVGEVRRIRWRPIDLESEPP